MLNLVTKSHNSQIYKYIIFNDDKGIQSDLNDIGEPNVDAILPALFIFLL